MPDTEEATGSIPVRSTTARAPTTRWGPAARITGYLPAAGSRLSSTSMPVVGSLRFGVLSDERALTPQPRQLSTASGQSSAGAPKGLPSDVLGEMKALAAGAALTFLLAGGEAAVVLLGSPSPPRVRTTRSGTSGTVRVRTTRSGTCATLGVWMTRRTHLIALDVARPGLPRDVGPARLRQLRFQEVKAMSENWFIASTDRVEGSERPARGA